MIDTGSMPLGGENEIEIWAGRKPDRLGVLDRRIAACQQRRRDAIMRAIRAVNSDEGALTRC